MAATTLKGALMASIRKGHFSALQIVGIRVAQAISTNPKVIQGSSISVIRVANTKIWRAL